MRTLIRWHGSKNRMAKDICDLLPPHRVFVEPYGGGAAVLLHKDPVEVEVLSELDAGLVNVYRIVGDPALKDDFYRRVWITKYSRETLKIPQPSDPVQWAAWLVSRGNLSHSASPGAGWRGNKNRPDGTSMASDHYRYRTWVGRFHRRLRNVIIHQEPAIDVMLRYDSKMTLHYCDPPYLHDERLQPKKHVYPFEMSKDQHVELLACLKSLRGMVVLSGYDSALYNDTLTGWEKHEIEVKDQGDNKRIECLWLNPAAAMASMVHRANAYEAARPKQLDLFALA